MDIVKSPYKYPKFTILDDCLDTKINSELLLNIFTKGRHNQLSLIIIEQKKILTEFEETEIQKIIYNKEYEKINNVISYERIEKIIHDNGL